MLRRNPGRGLRALLCWLLLSGAAVCGAQEAPPARVFHLVDAGLPPPPSARSGLRIDLYMPAGGTRPAPLLIYALGGKWSMPDPNYARGPALADALQRQGVATAVVRFALDDDYLLPRCSEDVARVVAFLAASAARYGLDPDRFVLSGHEAGGLLMANLALDAAPLARAGFARRPAGLAVLRSIFDLTPEALHGHPQEDLYAWAVGDARREWSPMFKVRGDAPPVLVLSGGDDLPGFAQRARAFARALEKAGAKSVQAHVVPERGAESLLNVSGEGNPVGALLAEFVSGDPLPEPIGEAFSVKQRWSMSPPLSTEPFRSDPGMVRTYPVDDRFRSMLAGVFEKQLYELNPWPGQTYQAVDALDWLATRPATEVGTGDHLVVTNLRGESLYFDRADLEAHRPRIVVGLDDERNLYRVFADYRMKRRYSWLPEADEPPVLIRPIGAFLYFGGDAPERLQNGSFIPFGLTPASFRWRKEDSLTPIDDLPAALRTTLTGCLSCHSFRGAGARSHHVSAESAQATGAWALSLEEYPPEVLRDFLLDQDRVAEMFGVKPLRVERPVADDLLALVRKERARAGNPVPILGPLPSSK